MVKTRTPTVCFALALACGGDDSSAGDAYMDDDVPSGNCMTGTGGDDCDTDSSPAEDSGPTTGPNAGECASSLDCDGGQACLATFDGDIGEFECRSACIADMDEASWCVDDEACCGVGSTCGPRGYCLPPESGDGSSTGTGG